MESGSNDSVGERKAVRITLEASSETVDRIFAMARERKFDHLPVEEIVIEQSSANPNDKRSWRRAEQLKHSAPADPGRSSR